MTTRTQPTEPVTVAASVQVTVRADRRGVAARHLVPAPRRAAVGAVGPHRRGHRPPGQRQDPRRADPRAAAGARRGAGHADEARRPAAEPDGPLGGGAAVCRARPVRRSHRVARAGLGPDRRVRRPDARRAAREGVHRRHRQGRRRRRARRRRRPVLRGRGRQGPAGLLPRGRVDRPHPAGRAALGREPAQRHRPDRDPAGAPARRTVLARAAVRGAPRRRPDRREHHHHRAADDEPVLPGADPAPLRPRARPARHRRRRRHRDGAAPSTCSAARTPTPARHR